MLTPAFLAPLLMPRDLTPLAMTDAALDAAAVIDPAAFAAGGPDRIAAEAWARTYFPKPYAALLDATQDGPALPDPPALELDPDA